MEGFFLSPPAHIVPKAFYLGVEDLALVHQGVDIGVRLFLEPPQSGQGCTMAVKTAAVPIGRRHVLNPPPLQIIKTSNTFYPRLIVYGQLGVLVFVNRQVLVK